MKKKFIQFIIYAGLSLYLTHCVGDDKPVTERILDHEKYVKAVSDSIRVAAENIDSLLLKK